MGRVDGKVVVITGAGRGQGRSHAVRLAEEGADIIALDVCQDNEIAEYPMASAEDLQETARLVEKAGRRVVALQADVRDRAALDSAIAEGVEQLGRLDAVVANAGISPVGANRPLRAFGDTVDVNLTGVLNTVHASMPHLGDGASVVVIGSAAGLLFDHGQPGPMGPGGTGYAFAKQALVQYVNWFAPFLAPSGRRLNAVHPANVDTEMIRNEAMYRIFRPDLEEPTFEDAVPGLTTVQAMPIPFVEPVDVSHAVVYLVSDESRFVTGLHLKVDGGALVNAGK
ncbi:mycofactocin-coupled SDR family oxidoreductase [Streptomyces sp. NPDC019531]|uniref:mycofactocin-coupled SDR family oxidoreductase n=1 Tax=Streptomyces sp. NPDC019531 TaxID=3365062 RepID=UPI00384F8C07